VQASAEVDKNLHSMIGYWHNTVVCLSVCLFVTPCIVAKRYILQQMFLNKWIGSAPIGTRKLHDFTVFNPTPTLFSHHWHWCHLANKLKPHCEQAIVSTLHCYSRLCRTIGSFLATATEH